MIFYFQVNKFVILERDLQDLRLCEFMIFSGLWLADLSKVCGFYKTSCYTLQILLLKLQKLHLASRYVNIFFLILQSENLVDSHFQSCSAAVSAW